MDNSQIPDVPDLGCGGASSGKTRYLCAKIDRMPPGVAAHLIVRAYLINSDHSNMSNRESAFCDPERRGQLTHGEVGAMWLVKCH